MASSFLHLFSLLLFLFIPVSSQLNELFFPGFKDSTTNITLSGVASFEKNGILRLTNETSRLQGHAFYSSPIQFKNLTTGKVFSFSTSFAVAIVPEYPKLGGHGLAFTISPSKNLKSLPSQYLGLFNSSDVGNFSNHLFAVEFDTVQDFEFQDINDNHIGIDINSLTSNASTTAAYFTDSSTKENLTLKSGKPIQAWIDYDAAENIINVTISPYSTKPRLPILSFRVDLSPIFQESMYIGFSSSTGLLASSHYILGWSFNINGPARGLDLSSLPSLPSPKKKHLGLTIGLSIASVILAISPELPKTGKATTSSDVYAFGALLLEVACGRRPIEPKAAPEELVLVDWVWDKYREGKVLDVIDRKLNGEYNEAEVFTVIKLGILCSNNAPMSRPTMRQVVRCLDGEVEVPEIVRAPDAVDSGKGTVEGFNELFNSFASSSFDKMSSHSFVENGATFASLSTSPLSLLPVRRETG
ncbi:hypothetical protein Pint_35371 [Pistacia integerrima]|uniref:Uncharacterized protein n=1 Tax=Pistacia integerrima TaxID=434235 RepID=A0ACC0Y3C7_9ROSI|nr:hypothetical protein Pint_35371 [Pistacia integerrima]